MNYHF